MDFKQIKELIKLVDTSNIGEVLIENDETSIRIRHQKYQKKVVNTTAPIQHAAPIAVPASIEANDTNFSSSKVEKTEDVEESDAATIDTANLVTVKSPMIGTFYRSASPEKPPFVKVGDTIDKEDTLCIIEAMKLFNEIESEFSGKIVKVLAENESPVEYDQPLFLIDPNG